MYVEEPLYYALTFRRAAEERILIWICADPDGVVLDTDGLVPHFPTFADAQEYASQHDFTLRDSENDLDQYDFDALDAWLRSPQPETVDCYLFLGIWNLCVDLAVSVHVPFDSDHALTNPVHDKLFYGNNLLSITPPGESFTPIWSASEVQLLHRVLTEGRSLFDQYVRA